MFSIKVEYRGKAFNLGKGVTSLERIYQEMTSRFPVDFKQGIVCTYADQPINDFQQLQKLAQSSNLASIKLKVSPKQAEPSKDSQELAQKEVPEVVMPKQETVVVEPQQSQPQGQQVEKPNQEKIQQPQDRKSKHSQSSGKVYSFKNSQNKPSKESVHQFSSKNSKLSSNASGKGSKKPALGKASDKSASIKVGDKDSRKSGSSDKILDSPAGSVSTKKTNSAKKSVGQKKESNIKRQSSEEKVAASRKSTENKIVDNHSQSRLSEKKEEPETYVERQNRFIRQSSKSDLISQGSHEKKSLSKKGSACGKKERSKSPQPRDETVENSQDKPQNKVQKNGQQSDIIKSESYDKSVHLKEESEIFECYKCQGTGIIKGLNCQCHICDGKGSFSDSHPFMNFINRVVELKVEKILSKLQIESFNFRKEESEVRKSGQKELDFRFEVILGPNQKNKLKVGQKFTWEIEIKNVGEDWPSKMELYDEQSGYMMAIDQLKSGRSQRVIVGPISYERVGFAEKVYRIGYFNERNQFKYLEQKFGFKVEVVASEKKGVLTNEFRKRVGDLSHKIKNKHSVEYLIEKFRELGINEENNKESPNEVLLDIIAMLQSQQH